MKNELDIEVLGTKLINGEVSKEREMVGTLLSNLDILKVRFGGVHGNYRFRDIVEETWKDKRFKEAFEHFSPLEFEKAKSLVDDGWFNFTTLDFDYQKLFRQTGRESIENVSTIEVQGNGYASIKYKSGKNSYWTNAMDITYLQNELENITGKKIKIIKS